MNDRYLPNIFANYFVAPGENPLISPVTNNIWIIHTITLTFSGDGVPTIAIMSINLQAFLVQPWNNSEGQSIVIPQLYIPIYETDTLGFSVGDDSVNFLVSGITQHRAAQAVPF